MTRRAGSIPEETKAKLLHSALEEFTEYGFDKASLRRICAKAEVTTGALYFFFQDKEDLFENVLAPITERIHAMMKEHYSEELKGSTEDVISNEAEDFRFGIEFLEMYYSNQKVCKLILNNREHPAVTAFFDSLIMMIDQQTIHLLETLLPAGVDSSVFNECTIHWVSHLQIDTFIHILSHDFDRERAEEQMRIMVHFLREGFFSLLRLAGMKPPKQ